jgi:predicted ATPase
VKLQLERLRGQLHCWNDRFVHGICRVQQDCESGAEHCFRIALEIAGRQMAKSLGLRAALSLARLSAKEGRRSEAHDLLAPIYGWFDEGLGSPDHKEAKALLDELRV